jgi:hypothetical protein
VLLLFSSDEGTTPAPAADVECEDDDEPAPAVAAAFAFNPGDEGGESGLGFHCSPPGFGLGGGGPCVFVSGFFSNAAILSLNEPGFGFGGGEL